MVTYRYRVSSGIPFISVCLPIQIMPYFPVNRYKNRLKYRYTVNTAPKTGIPWKNVYTVYTGIDDRKYFSYAVGNPVGRGGGNIGVCVDRGRFGRVISTYSKYRLLHYYCNRIKYMYTYLYVQICIYLYN